MREEIYRMIRSYYQNEISDDKDEFYFTPQYRALKRKRHEAKTFDLSWSSFKNIIHKKYPSFVLNDFSDLNEDAGWYLKIFLHKNILVFEDDRKMLDIAGKKLRTMNVFVSILGPYYFHYVAEMEWKDREQDQFNFFSVYEDEYGEPELSVAKTINDYWIKRGYNKMKKEDLEERMKDLYYEEIGDNHQLFAYLFSYTDGIL